MINKKIQKLQDEINMLDNTIKYFYDKKLSRGLSSEDYERYDVAKKAKKRKQKELEDIIKIFNNNNSIMSYTYTI